MSKRKHNVVRVLGERQRAYRGWTRKDRLKLNDKPLLGYVLVVKRSGQITETTHFYGRKVKGYQWVWLARLNHRTVRVDEEPVVEEIFSQHQIVEKVAKGELQPEQAVKMLEAA